MMNMEEYRKLVRETQDWLDEDDSVSQIARDMVDENQDLRNFLINELGESNPARRFQNDLY